MWLKQNCRLPVQYASCRHTDMPHAGDPDLVGLVFTPCAGTVKLPMLLELLSPLASSHMLLVTSQVTDA